MSSGERPGGRALRVVLARSLPEAEGSGDYPVHLVELSPDQQHGGGVCGMRLRPGQVDTPVRVSAAVEYRQLGWPVRVRDEQVWMNLDRDVDAVAVLIPARLAARVIEILVGRRCPPAVLAHPALTTHRVLVAGERYGVSLSWPAGVHRVTGALLLPPTVTAQGAVRWVRPPQPHSLQLCREIDVCAAVAATPPPSSPTVF